MLTKVIPAVLSPFALAAVASVAALSTSTAQVTWRELPANAPTIGAEGAMAYDPVRGRFVLFGGRERYNFGDIGDETWEWDGTSWLPRETPVRPTARYGASMVWDAARQRMVLFGGRSNLLSLLGDTWEWDGASWVRRATTGPARRMDHMMAYDEVRQRVVLFGGDTSGGSNATANDTWEWDGHTWTQRLPASPPPERADGVLVFDQRRGVMVLQGGRPAFSGALADTWEWDGTTWTQVSNGGPAAAYHDGFYDAARHAVMMYAGTAQQMFEYTGTGWVASTPPGAPPPRIGSTFAFDAANGRAVLLGGSNGAQSTPNRNTWEWNGTAWSLAAGLPEPRRNHATVYDHARQRLVLIGGDDAPAEFHEAWEWDGRRWFGPFSIPRTTRATRHAAAFHAGTAQTVIFGGGAPWGGTSALLDQTWAWNGSTWTNLLPVNKPSARDRHAMVADSARDRLVLFGGRTAQGAARDTWVWSGGDWLRLEPPTSPPARFDHALAYDEERDRVVLFGGVGEAGQDFSDTWEFDGQAWTEISVTNAPVARHAHAMEYDPDRRRVVMFGGVVFGAVVNETWEWDGAAWQRRQPSGVLTARKKASLSYDPIQRAMLLVGGDTSSFLISPVPSDEVWMFHPTHPAEYLRFGSSCPGTTGSPTLTAPPHTWPWIGSSFRIEVRDVPPNAGIGVAFGASATQWGALTLPVTLPGTGTPGCQVSISLDVVVPIPNVGGTGALAVAIPTTPSLLGQTFYNQAIVFDPSANPLGITTSNGACASIGAR